MSYYGMPNFQGAPYHVGHQGTRGGFTLIVVLFILLVIVGASYTK